MPPKRQRNVTHLRTRHQCMAQAWQGKGREGIWMTRGGTVGPNQPGSHSTRLINDRYLGPGPLESAVQPLQPNLRAAENQEEVATPSCLCVEMEFSSESSSEFKWPGPEGPGN